jgi:hypothetical protein
MCRRKSGESNISETFFERLMTPENMSGSKSDRVLESKEA